MFDDILEYLSERLKFVENFVWRHELWKQIEHNCCFREIHKGLAALEKHSRFTKKKSILKVVSVFQSKKTNVCKILNM